MSSAFGANFLRVLLISFAFLYGVALFVSIAAMEFTTAVLALAGLGLLISDMKNKRGSYSNPWLGLWIDKALLGYTLIVLMGAVLAAEDLKVFHSMVKDLRWILLLYCIAYLASAEFRAKWLPTAVGLFSIMAIIAGLYAGIQFIWGLEFFRSREVLVEARGFYRSVGFFNMPLTFAYSLGIATFILTGLTLVQWAEGRSWRLWLLPCIGSLMGFLGVALSLTRGAWLAAFVAITVLLIVFARKRVIFLTAVMFAGLFAVLWQNPLFQARVGSAFNFSSTTYTDRWALIRANWELFKDNPWVGVGLHRNSNYIAGYYEKLGIDSIMTGHAHNNVMQFLGGIGLFGTLAYLAFSMGFIVMAFRLFKSYNGNSSWLKGLALGIFGAQFYLHIGGLSECNFMDAEVKHMLVLSWVALVTLAKFSEAEGFKKVKV